MADLGANRTALAAPTGRESFRKKAIVGYTEHKARAPYSNPAWEMWGLNDLYIDLPHVPDANKRVRWFQVHQWRDIQQHDAPPDVLNFSEGPVNPRDPNHVAWMAQAAKEIPLYLIKARDEVPDALILPRDEMVTFFQYPYFTNTISYMIGMAIMELMAQYELPDGRTIWYALPDAEIGVFGVDMMVAGGAGSEYGWQRPSCEWLLGAALLAGIKVTIPDESDLLKSAFNYGEMEFQPFRKKLLSHRGEMARRLGQVVQNKNQMMLAEAELRGAQNTLDWIQNNWMPGDASPNGGPAPMPDSHKKQALVVAGEPIALPEVVASDGDDTT